jgi:hypothetical protein
MLTTSRGRSPLTIRGCSPGNCSGVGLSGFSVDNSPLHNACMPRRELLDELARIYARAAVDRYLEHLMREREKQLSTTNSDAPADQATSDVDEQ